MYKQVRALYRSFAYGKYSIGYTRKAPATPTGLAVDNEAETSLDLSWDAMDGTNHYYVYQDGVLIAITLTNSYSVADLTAETDYDFQVQAQGQSGMSAKCAAVTGTTTAAE
jgi:chitodextrinase